MARVHELATHIIGECTSAGYRTSLCQLEGILCVRQIACSRDMNDRRMPFMLCCAMAVPIMLGNTFLASISVHRFILWILQRRFLSLLPVICAQETCVPWA